MYSLLIAKKSYASIKYSINKDTKDEKELGFKVLMNAVSLKLDILRSSLF